MKRLRIADCGLRIAVGALLVIAAGCADTVVPKTATSKQASWDGTNQNSGFIGWAADGRGIISERKRERYNELISIYGKGFSPALKADDGLAPTATNTWIIDQQHLADMAEMERLRRDGK